MEGAIEFPATYLYAIGTYTYIDKAIWIACENDALQGNVESYIGQG